MTLDPGVHSIGPGASSVPVALLGRTTDTAMKPGLPGEGCWEAGCSAGCFIFLRV
jgi:hypothetical protein